MKIKGAPAKQQHSTEGKKSCFLSFFLGLADIDMEQMDENKKKKEFNTRDVVNIEIYLCLQK